MRKRILSLLLCLIICMATFSGCTFFEYDEEADYKQIVATISVTDSNSKNENDEIFVSGERYIYKYELLEELYSQISESGEDPDEDVVDGVLETLITRELIYAEMDRLFFTGELEWRGQKTYGETTLYSDYTDSNDVIESIFTMIDSELVTLQNEILAERGEDVADTSGTTTETGDTTYPTPEAEEDEDEYPETTIYVPENSKIPGKYGDADKISLEIQALERFTLNVVETVEESYKDYDEDLLQEAADEFAELVENNQYEELYLSLDKSYPIQFLVGDSARRSVEITILEDYLYDDKVIITESDVYAQYASTLSSQITSYDASADNYVSAMSSSEPILYRPNNDYFYVKHILVPFSDAQTAALTAEKAKPEYKYDEDYIESYRNSLVNEIVAYQHIDGEDDTSNPMTVNEVFNDVYSTVTKASSNQTEALAAFDEMIYLYNTDTGIFSLPNGYCVKKELDDGESETYMQEFADGARDLYENYNAGEMLSDYVVTDYGVHLMFYVADPDYGVDVIVDIDDWTDYTKTQTVYDYMYDLVEATKQSAVFTNWQNEKLVYYMMKTDSVTKHVSTYEEIYEPYEDDDE